MTNKEIYRRTLGFSIRKLLFDVIMVVLVVALCAAGFLLAQKLDENGAVGLVIGLIVGLIVAAIVTHFVGYIFKAGQIAMMTRAVTEGELPDDVIGEGKREVKERFLTVAAYYAATRAIKGIFNQLGNAVTKLGGSIGGETGSTVGSAVSTAVNTVIGYLCDCCLGWVFYRRDQGAVRSTLEGAVIFFKHGKTLLKNVGRIFGMGLLSLLVIGGAIAAVAYFVLSSFSAALEPICTEVAKAFAESESALAGFFSDPAKVPILIAIVIGLVFWGIIHGAFIRPFILTGVLRNYMESGMADVPTEASFGAVQRVSPKFGKLMAKMD